MKRVLFVLIAFLGTLGAEAQTQKLNTDSLLYKSLEDFQKGSYDLVIKQSHKAIAVAPDYLDFHLLLGRSYLMKDNYDSARYYLSHVVEKNEAYIEAFQFLIDTELRSGNYDQAGGVAEKAIDIHPGEKIFYRKKIASLQLQEREKEEKAFLASSLEKFPNDPDFRQRLYFLETKNKTDRVGVNYSITTFDRENVGPWHLVGAQYVRERDWGSLIGRVNYADRMSAGESITTGYQFELESYVFMGKNGYSHISGAYSNSIVFPSVRAAYSYYHNFRNGWETEVGARYVEMAGRNFRSGIVGVGKYFGSFWLNGRTFIQNEGTQFFPAFQLTSRYYFDSRFDYLNFIVGYGTSPDERATLNQFESRVAMDSYRTGIGYFRLWNDRIITGTQFTFNYQELMPGLQQNEYEVFLMVHYKF
ncbi:YaiO family outer membrane beta-barrel protein [Litoribacter ruber]|uniref:YaiO family outer membrane beta-barrel protein n=1 Tax=Litoribacter ruber TaxID=702568 RepID=UPI001BD9FE17|nr:YaiO family outer membrane beta-barrel protein [Litoribacter ruber]MBT0810218.1 YaiO family outer membrane beta-barrel protein [Litoribacter ruber]